jgi:hypothetical protein
MPRKDHSDMLQICQTAFQEAIVRVFLGMPRFFLCWLRIPTIAKNAPYGYNGVDRKKSERGIVQKRILLPKRRAFGFAQIIF